MKKNVNKEILIGSIVLIALSILAITLIVRKEMPKKEEMNIVNEQAQVESMDEVPAENEAAFELYRDVETDEIEIETETEEPKKTNVPNNITKKSKSDITVSQVEEYMVEPKQVAYTGEELWQLEELFHYWNDYQLDAVDDLIRLPRVRTLTNELSGTNGFYYYGDVDKNGKPNGKGIAVYADNAYYCGEWSNGKRHGNGMWLQIFPDKLGTVNGVFGVEEHNYNGKWSNDYPNGKGQEHISYVYDEIENSGKLDCIIANVIGNFKDGYYDGELYIMTFESENSQIDWEAEAKRGTFEYCENKESALGERCVWELMTDKEDIYFWMHPDENVNHGIYGLKKK